MDYLCTYVYINSVHTVSCQARSSQARSNKQARENLNNNNNLNNK